MIPELNCRITKRYINQIEPHFPFEEQLEQPPQQDFPAFISFVLRYITNPVYPNIKTPIIIPTIKSSFPLTMLAQLESHKKLPFLLLLNYICFSLPKTTCQFDKSMLKPTLQPPIETGL